MDHETGSQAPARSSNFGEQLQKLNEKWSDDIKIDTSVGNNDEPTTERPVVLRRSDELGETRVVAALLTPQSGCSYGQVLEAVKKTEGENRRQLFLEVRDIRRYHADELNGALEMLNYEFSMLVSREQLGLIRRTTHATVIEEALRPDDMPGEPGDWPTGPGQGNDRFSGADCCSPPERSRPTGRRTRQAPPHPVGQARTASLSRPDPCGGPESAA